MSNSAPTIPSVYDPVAKALHWAIAALLAAQFTIGWTMPHVRKGTLPVGAIGWHVTVGVAIILLVAARIVWRFARPPKVPPTDRGAVARAAQIMHLLLYVLMAVVPVLGWANASSRDWAVGLTPWLELPRIMPVGSKLGHDFGDLHGNLAIVLAVIIGLHVAAGLYHQFVVRDQTLRRMV
jgi:cytochrome b561